MIRIVSEEGSSFDIIPDGQRLNLYINGKFKGEIASLPACIQKGHTAIFGCRIVGTKAVKCITTGTIKSIK